MLINDPMHLPIRYAVVIKLLFLIRHLHVIGVMLGKGQRTSTTKTHV